MVKCFYILICIAVLCLCSRRVAFGNESVMEKKYLVYFVKSPFSKADDDSWMCAGALVSPKQILTAAACLVEMEKIYAIAGYKNYVHGRDIDKDECTRMSKQKVVKVIVPKEYKLSSDKPVRAINVDIGVAIVEKPYNFPDQGYRVHCSYEPQIILINFEKTNDATKSRVVAAGWGGQRTASPSISSTQDIKLQTLQEATMMIVDNKDCLSLAPNEELKKLLDKYFFCVSGDTLLDGDNEESKSGRDMERCSLDKRDDLTRGLDESCPEDDFDFRRRNTNVNKTRGLCNDQIDDKRYEVNEIEIKWPESPFNKYPPEGYVNKIPAFIRQGNEEEPLHVRPTKDLVDFQNDSGKPPQYGKRAELGYEPQFDQKRSQYYAPQDQFQDQMQGQLNAQYREQFQRPQQQQPYDAYDQPREESNVNLYKPPQEDPYRQPQVDSYNQPHMDSYSQPQVDPYSQPQVDSYNPTQADPYNQPQVDSYSQPRLDSYSQPRLDSYNPSQVDPYNSPSQIDSYGSPQVDSYNQPQVESYNQPQETSYSQPQVQPYDQPQVQSYNEPQASLNNQPQIDSYNSPQMESYNSPQMESYNPSKNESYNPPKIESYNPPQFEIYNPTKMVSYNQPLVEPYGKTVIEPYNQPPVESYKKTLIDTNIQPHGQIYKQLQIDAFKPPHVESYKQPQGESNNQQQIDQFKESYKSPQLQLFNQPQADLNNKPETALIKQPIQPYLSQLEPNKQPQIPSLNNPDMISMNTSSAESYNPLDIISGKKTQEDSFKIPIVEPFKSSPEEPYKQPAQESYNMSQPFKTAPVEPYEQPHLRQLDQLRLHQNVVQPFEAPQSPLLTQPVEPSQNVLRERQPAPTTEQSSDNQTFEQLYSQLNFPAISPPVKPASEQTFEELYKNLHEPGVELPHDPDFEISRGVTEQDFDQPFDAIFGPKLSDDAENMGTQPSEKKPDEIKVRPQVPLDYQDYLSYSRRKDAN